MEGSVTLREEDVRVEEDAEGSKLPESVQLAAAEKQPKEIPASVEIDAMEWLLSTDGPTEEETQPTAVKFTMGGREVEWRIVPLPDSEFKKFRRMVTGNRRARRAIMQGDIAEVDDWKYHCLVVAAATVYPDLKEAARIKGVDELAIIQHRFQAKPGIINQISGLISDISGYDEGDVEVVSKALGNS